MARARRRVSLIKGFIVVSSEMSLRRVVEREGELDDIRVVVRTEAARRRRAWPCPRRVPQHSVQVHPNHVENLLASIARISSAMPVPVNDVKAHVVFQHLPQQAVDRATTGSNPLQHLRTFQFLTERALDSLDLATNSPDSIDQSLLVTERVCHGQYPTSVVGRVQGTGSILIPPICIGLKKH